MNTAYTECPLQSVIAYYHKHYIVWLLLRVILLTALYCWVVQSITIDLQVHCIIFMEKSEFVQELFEPS